MSRFVMLSGPSCVGKGPLYKALRKFYPDLAGRLQQIVLYNSRDPRPGEQEGVDYYFRSRSKIEELGTKPGFTSAIVRGDLQAIEVASIRAILDQGQDAFFEGNPFIPATIHNAGIGMPKEMEDPHRVASPPVTFITIKNNRCVWANTVIRHKLGKSFAVKVFAP